MLGNKGKGSIFSLKETKRVITVKWRVRYFIKKIYLQRTFFGHRKSKYRLHVRYYFINVNFIRCDNSIVVMQENNLA